MTPSTSLGSDCSYMWRNTVQTGGRIVYNVAAHTQGDVSRDMCRGSSLCWNSVLVGVFFANSADDLNMRQPGSHLPGYGRLRPLGYGFTSTPTHFLYSTFFCQLTSVLRLIPVGAKFSFWAEVLFFIGVHLGIAVVYFVADLYVLEPLFSFIFEPMVAMAEHARIISLRWPSPSSVSHP